MNRGFSNGSTTPGLNGSAATANDSNQTNSTNTTPMKPCRYALNCSRVDCHFTHPDRRSPSSIGAAASTSAQSTATPQTSAGGGRSNTWFPLQFNMGIDDDTNELNIDLKSIVENGTTNHSTAGTTSLGTLDSTSLQDNNEDAVDYKTDDGGSDMSKERKISETTVSSTSSHSSGTANCSRKSYKLTAVVCQINNASQKNLIALIYVGSRYHEMQFGEEDRRPGQWYIFNDFRYVTRMYINIYYLAIKPNAHGYF